MTTVTLDAAKADLARQIDRALRGEEFVIARDDKPVVRLVPVEAPKPKRVAGTLKGKLDVPDSFFDPLPEEELRLWEGG